MHTHEPSQQNSQEHQSESGFDGSAFQLTGSPAPFADNRPDSMVRRNQQLAANQSPQVTQLMALQQQVSQGPRMSQAPPTQLMRTPAPPMQLMRTQPTVPVQLTSTATQAAPIQRMRHFKDEEEAILYFEEWETEEELEEHYDEALEIKTLASKNGWADLLERVNYRLSTYQAEVGPALSEDQARLEWEALDQNGAHALEAATALLLRVQEYNWDSLEDEIIQFVRREEDARDGLEDNAPDSSVAPQQAPAVWFGIAPQSPAGQWITRIMEAPFAAIEGEFAAYVKHHYESVELQSKDGAGAHVAQVMDQIKKAKNYITMLDKGMKAQLQAGKAEDDPNILKIKDKISYFIDVIVRMVPQPPAHNVRILANQDVVVPDNGLGAAACKLIRRGADWFTVGQDGLEQPAHGDFVFVVPVQTGEVILGTRADGGHTIISRGGDVYYAGELKLTNGQLDFWENESGHYRTTEDQKDVIAQIGLGNVLPIGKFRKAH